jgi:hypothetical protein
MAAIVRLKKIVRPYRPSNGEEGRYFTETHCERCIKDAAVNRAGEDADWEGGCQILARTLAFNVNDPKYPTEWIETDDGPMCTAYVPDDGQDPNQPTPRELESAGQGRLL